MQLSDSLDGIYLPPPLKNNSTTMKDIAKKISDWILEYATGANKKTLVVGISGGIDSSVVSTLCAMTSLQTVAVSLPLKQRADLHGLSLLHGRWLKEKFKNVEFIEHDLTPVFNQFHALFHDNNGLAQANTKSRLRMVTLYHIAQLRDGLVVGTGNKVEDFGVGFFTKYGDGGVDISPIGDCLKTQVWEIGRVLGVHEDIINSEPTDGLWEDGRTDMDQLGGIPYSEIEQSMIKHESGQPMTTSNDLLYLKLRSKSLHKMNPIPVCKIT